ncbi:hypothetical protein ASD11_06955 [Aeromicrobium sp. Root495]|uniref:glycoside hydrolase family 16 protein n=1 Tax=Aeromicrobium sp. Root495 TaxID=1736550 RepID=UPI0006F21B08|nr:glycoside hydrolase family 16 protein [Aeromicrobium sp. Root495]KQY59307.1 hypothetical protein ASD11_06955 [Aeromicrobium sp. Root495]
MGDRTDASSSARRTRRRALASGAVVVMGLLAGVAPVGAGAAGLAGTTVSPTAIPNADFSAGHRSWRVSTRTESTIITRGSHHAMRLKNRSTAAKRTLALSSVPGSTGFVAGSTVVVRAEVSSSRRRGVAGLHLVERSASGTALRSVSAPSKRVYSGYRTVRTSITIPSATRRVSVRLFVRGARRDQSIRFRNITYRVVPPAASSPGPTEPDPGATPTEPTASAPTAPAPGVGCSSLNDPSQRVLTFADEFDGSSVDASKWRVRDDDHLSFDAAYLKKENVTVRNGALTIAGRRMSEAKTVSGGQSQRWYSTGYLDTIGKFSQEHGRWEMRAKLPTDGTRTRGVWPAFWLRGDRTAGEIDIMETYGSPSTQTRYNPSSSYQATLWQDTNLGPKAGKWTAWAHQDWQTHTPAVYEGYHVYGVNWMADCLQFTIDDTVFATVSTKDVPWMSTAFSGPFNIRLNMQVGSSYWGMPDRQNTKDAFDYVVDYVRVYRPGS